MGLYFIPNTFKDNVRMTEKDLLALGKAIDDTLDTMKMNRRPDLFIVVDKEEFKQLDWRVYYALNHTSDGYVESEDEMVVNFVNHSIHVFYDEEKKKEAESRETPTHREGFFAFLLRRKVRK